MSIRAARTKAMRTGGFLAVLANARPAPWNRGREALPPCRCLSKNVLRSSALAGDDHCNFSLADVKAFSGRRDLEREALHNFVDQCLKAVFGCRQLFVQVVDARRSERSRPRPNECEHLFGQAAENSGSLGNQGALAFRRAGKCLSIRQSAAGIHRKLAIVGAPLARRIVVLRPSRADPSAVTRAQVECAMHFSCWRMEPVLPTADSSIGGTSAGGCGGEFQDIAEHILSADHRRRSRGIAGHFQNTCWLRTPRAESVVSSTRRTRAGYIRIP